jgi:hypothetical protein
MFPEELLIVLPGDINPSQRNILIDGHVHIHRCFGWTVLLDSAAANFERAAKQLGLTDMPGLVLLLCDDSRFSAFASLRASALAGTVESGWALQAGCEDDSVVARRADGREIHLCAGRQVRTSDGLEVLAVCTDQELPDGHCLETTLDLVQATQGIPVIPWGFGKWMGRRGRIIRDVFNDRSKALLLAGDNGGRPEGFPEPVQLRRARQTGIPILAGSDPLPFPGEERRAGGYGSHTLGVFDSSNACSSVRKILRERPGRFKTFGRLEQPFRFFRNQVRMQLQMHKDRVASRVEGS